MYSFIKEYTSKNRDFMLRVSSLIKGGIIHELVNGQIIKPGVGLTVNEVKLCMDKYKLVDYTLIERTEY